MTIIFFLCLVYGIGYCIIYVFSGVSLSVIVSSFSCIISPFLRGIGRKKTVSQSYDQLRQGFFFLPFLYLVSFFVFLILLLFAIQIMGVAALPTLDTMQSSMVTHILYNMCLLSFMMVLFVLFVQLKASRGWWLLAVVFCLVFSTYIMKALIFLFQIFFILFGQLFY